MLPHLRSLLAFASALTALTLAAPERAQACSCLQRTAEEAARDATAVFEGHVKAITDADNARVVKLAVVRVFRGDLAKKESLEVRTAMDSAACGFNFESGKSYLVYAQEHEGALWVSLCSRTQPMSGAGEDLKVLGMGITPFDPGSSAEAPAPSSSPNVTAPAPQSGGCASCSIGADAKTPTPSKLGWALAMGFAFVTCRRRSRRQP